MEFVFVRLGIAADEASQDTVFLGRREVGSGTQHWSGVAEREQRAADMCSSACCCLWGAERGAVRCGFWGLWRVKGWSGLRTCALTRRWKGFFHLVDSCLKWDWSSWLFPHLWLIRLETGYWVLWGDKGIGVRVWRLEGRDEGKVELRIQNFAEGPRVIFLWGFDGWS